MASQMLESRPSSHQALLKLEEGNGEPPAQLSQAANIIRVDLTFGSNEKADQDSHSFPTLSWCAPKEEWVLRWLMKKLKMPDAKGRRFRLTEDSWTLLRCLVKRVPPRSLTSILYEYKFLEVLDKTLCDLDYTPEGQTPDGEHASSNDGSSADKRGKKRKRQIKQQDESQGADAEVLPVHKENAFNSMLHSVTALANLASTSLNGTHVNMKSKVHLIFRTEVEVAAKMLAMIYRHTVMPLSRDIPAGATFTDQLTKYLPACHLLWDCRSNRSGASSNDIFTATVLPEALSLLRTLRKVPQTAPVTAAIEIVERLVALHVVLPLRASFMAITPESTSSTDGPAPSRVTSVFNELRAKMKERDADLTPELLPTLLDVVARSVPRDTFRRRMNEASWLETFFIAMSCRCGCAPFADPLWDSIENKSLLLRDLFQVALDRHIQLSLATLTKFAQLYAGLATEDEEADWDLVAKIIRMSVDVFLLNSGLDISKDLLNKLVSKIASLRLSGELDNQATQETVAFGIVIPLMRGFASARDLESFVSVWTAQLVELGRSHARNAALPITSVWESDDVASAFGAIFDGFSEVQAAEHIRQLTSKLDDPEQRYPSVVFLDAIFSSAASSGKTVKGSNQDIIAKVTQLLVSRPFYEWRLWRLTSHLVQGLASSASDLPSDFSSRILPAVKDALVFDHKRLARASSSDLLVSFEAFNAIASLASLEESKPYIECLDSCIPKLAELVVALNSHLSLRWSGRVESITSPAALCVAYLTVLTANPSCVARISSENRKRLMKAIISESDLCTFSGENNTLTAVWKTFVSPDWLHSTPTIVADFVGAVYDHIKEVDSLTPNSLKTLASIPAPLISPHQRSTLLDVLLQYMLTKKCELSNVGILSLMTHLVELPKSSTSRIVSDAKEVWELGKAFTPREVEKNPPYACFRQLFTAVLGRVLLSSESNRRAWFKGLAQLVLEPSQTKSALPLDSLEQFVRVLAIEALIKHQDQLDDAQTVERLQALRKDACDAISDEVKAIYRRAKSQKIEHDDGEKLLAALACLQEFTSIQSKEAVKYLKKIDVSGASWNPKVSQAVMTSRIHLQKLADEEVDAFLLSCLSAFSASRLQVQEEKLALCEVQKRLAELNQDQIGELLSRLELPDADGDDFVRRLLVAGVGLAGLQPVEDRASVASKSLSVFLSQLCACLPLCKTMESFSLLMESVDIILRTQSRSVTQWNVDNLMAALSVAVSPSGLKHLAGTDAPGVLYTRICRVAGMLFLQYRQKLSGRMHLVVPLMQRLLRCLFRYDAIPGAPGVTQAKLAKTVNTLPPWISVDDEACQVTADPEHAFQYTRLLTLLCDPTVSAVQRHSHARPTDSGPVSRLTDNTKKVKSLAGQHLQYVVMEYALCSIRGRLQPAVKAALVPGLYAILDVMTREGMRGMNAAMDGSSRAIFRSLYEDYVRFGRWDQG